MRSTLICSFAAAAGTAAGLISWLSDDGRKPAAAPTAAERVAVNDPLDSDDGVWGAVVGGAPAPFWRKGEGPTYSPPWFANVGAVTREIRSTRDLFAATSQLRPGDHLLVHGGNYTLGPALQLRAGGTEGQPIAISAAQGEEVVFMRADAQKNVIDVIDSKYLLIEGLHVRGGSNGIKFYAADHVMLYGLEVGHTDGAAITANAAETSHLSIVDCEVHHTGGHGEALYLGGHNGKNITHHTRVVGNYIHDLAGDHVEQGDGIEVKQGSHDVIVRYNFIRNTKYPGITVYGADAAGSRRNLIESNVIIDSQDAALQVAADAIVRNNLVINKLGRGRTFLSKPEELVSPRNLLVMHNTFVASGRVATLNGWAGPADRSIVFVNNALYSSEKDYVFGGTEGAVMQANVGVNSLATFTAFDPSGPALDASPKSGGALQGTGSAAFTTAQDLNGRQRSPTQVDVGAFVAVDGR